MNSRTGDNVQTHTGMGDVARVERALSELRALDYRSGGGACLDAVRVQVAMAYHMLMTTMAESVRDRLELALADLHNLAGWTSFDLGLVDDAHQQFERALELATAGEHHDLVANVHYRTGRVYLHHDAPDQALVEFAEGRSEAQRARSALAQAILSVNEAWAHAKQGHAAEALHLLGQAEEEFAGSDPGSAPPWARFFDANDLTAMIGTVHTELAQTADPRYAHTAIPAVSEAIAGYGDDMARSRSFNRIALAVNHLIDGDLDEGFVVGSRALAESATLRSTRTGDRMRPLLQEAGRHPKRAEMRELSERIAAYLTS